MMLTKTSYAHAAFMFRADGGAWEEQIFRTGLNSYELDDDDDRNRWGDYTATWVDTDGLSFWTIGEYADEQVNKWSTWWAHITSAGATGDTCADLEVMHTPVDAVDGVIVGTNHDDIILGSNGPDIIEGKGGDDIICSLGGSDTVYGDAGNDTIYGGDARDVIIGGGGRDLLYGEDGNDKLVGNRGNDTGDGGDGGDGTDTCESIETATSCET